MEGTGAAGCPDGWLTRPYPSSVLLCSYFFDRPDDEAPENRLQTGWGAAATGARRSAASKSFAGQRAPAGGQQQQKGEPAAQLAFA